MPISVLEALGPVMIGPSSSHTAGAARLGRTAAQIAGSGFRSVEFGLYGSFASTGSGHGTDRALVAGVLGLREDDERLRDAFALAQERGLAYSFGEVNLPGAHENSVRMVFHFPDGHRCKVTGSSVGGGEILITRVDGFTAELNCHLPALLITQNDARGVIGHVSSALASGGVNIATMRVSRRRKDGEACCTIETDGIVPEAIVQALRELPDVHSVRVITVE